jgi:hypothetical protein
MLHGKGRMSHRIRALTSSQLITPLCLQLDISHSVSVAVDASRASTPLSAHCEKVQSLAVKAACARCEVKIEARRLR